MCGRAVLAVSGEELMSAFGLSEMPELAPRYNIAPTQPIAVVREPGKLELIRWGLPAEGGRGHRINVRGESVATAYRESFRARRCLVVASGFYEWQRGKDVGHARGVPFVIRREDGAPFALAGIWERRVTADGEVHDSCAVVTGPAKGVIAPIHDRMPVVVPRAAFTQWLTGDAGQAHEWLVPSADALVAYEVSTRVNSPANDDAKCVEPAAPEQRTGNLSLF